MAVKRRSWIQPSEAASYFDVGASTIRKWVSEGTLQGAQLPTGHLRILARDVARRLLKDGKAVPSELADLARKHVLIVDPNEAWAESVAVALRDTSRCRVTVIRSSEDVRGLLNGTRPDLVLLGVRPRRMLPSHNGDMDMLILAATSDDPAADGAPQVTFRVNEILPPGADEQTVAARVVGALLR
jgi:excisionase family DNA binding protein